MIKYLITLIALFILSSCQKTVVEYWPNGKKKQETQFKGKKIHGTFTLWRKSGRKEMQSHFENGELMGKSIIWHSNGKIKSEENYCNGMKCGKVNTYKYSGNKKTEENYKNDTLYGFFTEWHSEVDKKMKEGKYYKGLYDGKWLFWGISGKIVGIGDFDKGEGEMKEFDYDGNLIFRSLYSDNVQDSIIFSAHKIPN